MNAPTKDRVVYPEPEAVELNAPPRAWLRCRIVIPCFDEEQANRISEKVAEICGHSLEHLWCITDDEGTVVRGETVVGRRIVPVSAEALIEEPVPV